MRSFTWKACQREVAADAKQCPSCGKPYPGKHVGGPLQFIAVLVILYIALELVTGIFFK